ncbi:hypothetical protein ACJX0J_030460, partial [Zea mays]
THSFNLHVYDQWTILFQNVYTLWNNIIFLVFKRGMYGQWLLIIFVMLSASLAFVHAERVCVRTLLHFMKTYDSIHLNV